MSSPPVYVAQSQEELIPKKEERFIPKPYQDVWALILWIFCMLGFTGITGFAIYSVSNAINNYSPDNGSVYAGPDSHQSGLLAGYVILTVFSGFLFCLGYLIALQKYAGTIIHITLVLAILLYAAGAVAAAIYQIYSYTIAAALLAALNMAVYGKDYCTAAKSTLNLLRARGIEPIINDCFTHVVLNMGSLFISAIVIGLGVLYIYLAFDYNLYQALLPSAIVVGFFVSQVEFHVLGNVIRSGVATSYVCMAEDPEALRNTKPELYEKVNQAYPQILNPV
ncbi:putative choline transporter, neither null mutation nor overexpression affects choline transport [Boothiomyces sp. JEL0866]|nr:putative choline transporter, neither null mutation nor overexpression affects choline transport [Boothiomyces sp. JEL0866]